MSKLILECHDLLQCKIEHNNEFDPSVVVISHDDCLEQKAVGPIPLNLSKIFHCFLKVLYCSTSSMVIGKRMNRGAGIKLEIPVEYSFFGGKRVVSWAYTHKKWK